MGHKRNECPNIICKTCRRNGHFSHQCRGRYEGNVENNLSRYNERTDEQSGDRVRGFDNRRNTYGRRQYVAGMEDSVDDSDFRHPNEQAPLQDEVIGAMC